MNENKNHIDQQEDSMKNSSSEQGIVFTFNVPRAATEIGISQSRLYTWIRLGLIPVTNRYRGEIRIKASIAKIAKAAYEKHGPTAWQKHVVWTEEKKDSGPSLHDFDSVNYSTRKLINPVDEVITKHTALDPKKVARAAECLYEHGHKEIALVLTMSVMDRVA
ncbi:MAG: hypothetical protein ACXVB1_00105 [Pseudobdellovibrionaceae bacterium]